MSSWSSARDAVDIIIGLGLPGAAAWYWRDRKKNRAAKRARDEQRDEVHVTYVERAFAMERESLKRQIKSCQEQIHQQAEEIAALRAEIIILRSQINPPAHPAQ
jgi:uncharacterized protein HemX